jgi:hypothetical protein
MVVGMEDLQIGALRTCRSRLSDLSVPRFLDQERRKEIEMALGHIKWIHFHDQVLVLRTVDASDSPPTKTALSPTQMIEVRHHRINNHPGQDQFMIAQLMVLVVAHQLPQSAQHFPVSLKKRTECHRYPDHNFARKLLSKDLRKDHSHPLVCLQSGR